MTLDEGREGENTRTEAVDLNQVIGLMLADYAAVEPGPGAVESWLSRRKAWRARSRFLGLGAPAWAALAALILLLLGVSWYREHRARAKARLAQESSRVMALPGAPPPTEREQQLIQLMQTDPAALATIPAEEQPELKPAAKAPARAKAPIGH